MNAPAANAKSLTYFFKPTAGPTLDERNSRSYVNHVKAMCCFGYRVDSEKATYAVERALVFSMISDRTDFRPDPSCFTLKAIPGCGLRHVSVDGSIRSTSCAQSSSVDGRTLPNNTCIACTGIPGLKAYTLQITKFLKPSEPTTRLDCLPTVELLDRCREVTKQYRDCRWELCHELKRKAKLIDENRIERLKNTPLPLHSPYPCTPLAPALPSPLHSPRPCRERRRRT